jgi:F-type H+-transporting ATPase subunit b
MTTLVTLGLSMASAATIGLASEGNFFVNELSHATFWVMIALFIFLGAAVYFGVFKTGLSMLDERSAAIAKEIDDARALKEEAQALLASYQRKQKEAEDEATEIVAQATKEAEQMAKEAVIKLTEQIERRTAMAEQKIASAEAQALSDVRAIAADVAIAAAGDIITEQVKGAKSEEIISKGIEELKTKLH